MIKAFVCLSLLLTACSIQAASSLDLTELFSSTHAERAHGVSKRSVASDSSSEFSYNADYCYHGRDYASHSGVDSSLINDYATTALKVSAKLLSTKFTPLQARDPKSVLSGFKAPQKFCPFKKQTTCNFRFPYRTLDGSCNNMKNPWWGKSEAPFSRWLSADYSDQFKLNEPRASVDGSELPNPRLLSCALNGDFHDIEPSVSHMFMQWGQLINHDITSLSITREDDVDKTVCNQCLKSDKCLPIMIDSNTTCNCIKTMKHNCIEFTRSSASFGDIDCTLGPREQVNMQTAFLDGSHIYGSSDSANEQIRDRQSGKGLLLVQRRSTNPREDLMPQSRAERPSDCLDFTPTTKCFVAGDDRVNQNPVLMSMHTIFVREHNRIATILHSLNPTWSDDLLFHEARRVVIAQIQHISYNEYLPVLLGETTMRQFKLTPGKGFEKLSIYDENVDPRVTNEYAASAGRFGHSMVRTEYSRLDKNYKSAGVKSFMLRNSYFRANDLYDREEGGLEAIVRGMLKDPLMKVDTWFTTELTQHLFEVKNSMSQPFHFDLASINIQRGRDHGISGYTRFREFCGLSPVRSWEEMALVIPADLVSTYRQFYRHVEDVDLFLAAIAEHKNQEGLVGPTLKCLLGRQFQALKFGDRFWYETDMAPADFTFGQLMELRKTSLAKILCRNMNDTPKVQPLALRSFREAGNELVDCDTLADIDWKFWKV